MKTSRLRINTILSLLAQLVTIISGFVLPRAILAVYGSSINGLISSISQFLSIIGLLDLGVGAVLQAAYYKPLSINDYRTLGLIFYDSKKFFRRIALFLVLYVFVVVFIVWGTYSESFSFYYILTLVICIAVSFFTQYFFGAPYNLLLNADQKFHLTAGLQIILILLNVALSLILIFLHAPIQIVKLFSSLIFLIQPAVVFLYVVKKYPLIKPRNDENYHLEQKWNGVAQHVATVVMNNADVVVLTLFTNLITVSIYSVTCIVINGMKSLVSSISNSFMSFFGDLFAKKDMDNLRKHFDFFEWGVHTVSTLLCSLTGILILGFISNYTRNLPDANDYIQPAFALLMVCGLFIYCIRIPYNAIVCGAGHFKQTQFSAILEAIINITISVLLVFSLGLIGVALGTLLALIYRTIYFVYYLHNNIIFRNYWSFLKNVIVDILEAGLIVLVGVVLSNIFRPDSGYWNWLLTAISTGVFSLFFVFAINMVFYRSYMLSIFRHIFKGRGRSI